MEKEGGNESPQGFQGLTYQRNEQRAEHADHGGGRYLMKKLRSHDELVDRR